MQKIVTYKQDGIIKRKSFPIKGNKNSTGLHIREEPKEEIRKLILTEGVDYLGSRIVD